MANTPTGLIPRTPSADIPRRLTLTVDVPAKLSTRNIDECVNVAASRLRWRLSQEAQARNRERVMARIARRER
jgi:hypothetical protein